MRAYSAPTILLVVLLLTGCERYPPSGLQATATQPLSPEPPTSTPIPLAARVNSIPITQQEFEDEVRRYESAQTAAGIDLATITGYPERVLAALIDLKLLAQGALDLGKSVSDAELESRLTTLTAEFSDASTFDQWQAMAGYTPDTFRVALREQVLAAWMVEAIVQELPTQMDQVHARHILVSTMAEAEENLASLASGTDFATLAKQVSQDASTRLAGGDLGWFPQGYLLVSEVDEAAFSLEAGSISGIVESNLGYHLVQTLERGTHPVDADVQRWLREQAVQNWLAEQRGVSEIELFITP